ncbi:MAG TPA: FixH family protein [Polyangiaceae bacterium]|nr:FixH family protein [Polyangiaceae bacterium]
MSRLRRGALPALFALVLGCGSEADEPDAEPGPSVSCTQDPRLDAYAGSLDKAGELGTLLFRFSDFNPTLPSRGNNTFHVQLLDAEGAPVGGAASPGAVTLGVDLLMPDHGHGTSVEPVVSFDAGTGRYTLTPLYLFMPGVWRVQLEAEPSGGGATLDRVALHLCIEG